MTINRATAAPISNARIEFIPEYINIPAIISIIMEGNAIDNKTLAIPIDLNNLFILRHF